MEKPGFLSCPDENVEILPSTPLSLNTERSTTEDGRVNLPAGRLVCLQENCLSTETSNFMLAPWQTKH